MTAACIASVAFPAPVARADASPVTVQITSAVASGALPSDSVTLTGTVTNQSSAPATAVAVNLWRSTEKLQSTSQVAAAYSSDEPPIGAVFSTLSSAKDGMAQALPAGASAPFKVSATLKDLGWSEGASFWIGAVGSARVGGSASVRSAPSRTLVTVPTSSPTCVTSVVELSSTPRLVKPNVLMDDSLTDELAPTGRLGKLLDAAAHTSWLVDPELISTVTDMADGYRVLKEGGTQPGKGAEVAQQWLAQFRELPQAAGAQTLFGRPDLTGAEGDALVLRTALEATDGVDLALPRVISATRLSPQVLANATTSGLPILSKASPDGLPPSTMNGATVLSATALDQPTASPSLVSSELNRSARLIALSQVSSAQIRLLTSESALAADRAATPSWSCKRSLPEVLRLPASEATGVPATPSVPGSLDPGTVTRLRDLHNNLSLYGDLSPRTGLSAAASSLPARVASESWLGHPLERVEYWTAIDTATGISRLDGGIKLSAMPTITLSSPDTQFPATVTNLLSDPITVRVTGTSDNSARLSVKPSNLVTINPGDSETVMLGARAEGNGIVSVALHVEAQNGVGASNEVSIEMEATNLGQLGWIIVIASGIVLAGATAFRIRQVRRKNSVTA